MWKDESQVCMKVVADFNNTVSDAPEFFKGMKNLTIITGTSQDGVENVIKFLKKHRIKAKLISCPFVWQTGEEYVRAKVWKTLAVADEKPDIFFDDNIRELLQVQRLSPKTIGMLVVKNEIQVMGEKKTKWVGEVAYHALPERRKLASTRQMNNGMDWETGFDHVFGKTDSNHCQVGKKRVKAFIHDLIPQIRQLAINETRGQMAKWAEERAGKVHSEAPLGGCTGRERKMA